MATSGLLKPSFILISIFLTIATAQNSDDPPTSAARHELNVGFQDGPNGRGTVALVSGCLATVIASTWTVLHLNLPSPRDGSLTTASRKIKWMLITIVFPEFILSKAICELRQAVDDLRECHTQLSTLDESDVAWTIDAGPYKHRICWKAGYGRTARLLSRLLRLPEHAAASENNAPDARAEAEAGITTVQYWTLTHSYYANMGGLLYVDHSPVGNPETRTKLPVYAVLTASRLSRDIGSAPHPLRGLVLDEGDIKDKSKADWLVKAAAVFQIAQLILDVAVRAAAALPVTQLEIATCAFSAFAVATYVSNWWKPYGISQPTKLPYPLFSTMPWQERAQSVMLRLLSPARAAQQARYSTRDNRVPNDVLWMESDRVPLVTTIMATTSLVFGAIHCIAWNFEFPTQVELMCWRVASITTALLPFLSLLCALLLNYVATTRSETQRTLSLLNCLKPLDNAGWWKVATEIQPDQETDGHMRHDEGHGAALAELRAALQDMRRQWEAAKDPALTTEQTPFRHGESTWTRTQRLRRTLESCQIPDVIEKYKRVDEAKWVRYEETILRQKPNNPGMAMKSGIPEALCRAFERYQKLVNAVEWRQSQLKRVSQALVILTSLVYTTARIVMLALLFSCLRAAPAGIYKDTPWTHFIPNFS